MSPKAEERPGIKIFAFDSPIIFANAEVFHDQLYKTLGFDLQRVRKAYRAKVKRSVFARFLAALPSKSNGAVVANGVCAKEEALSPEAAAKVSAAGDQESEDSLPSTPELELPRNASCVTITPVDAAVRRPSCELLKSLPHHVVVDLSCVPYVDSNGAAMIEQVVSVSCKSTLTSK